MKKLDFSQKRLFINKCELSALEFEISFLARKGFLLGEKEDAFDLQSTMNWWGVALINIDEAPVFIKPFVEVQLFGQDEDIYSVITTHYKDALRKNLLNLIGSSEILGNPTKFIKKISNGMADFKNKPFDYYHQSEGRVG